MLFHAHLLGSSVLSFRLHYATDFEHPACLRPFQLAWRADTGVSGYLEPEQACSIMEVMMTEGLPGLVFLSLAAD